MPDHFMLTEDEQATIGFRFKRLDGKDATVEAGSLIAYSTNSSLATAELNEDGKLVIKARAGDGDVACGVKADADLGPGVKPIKREWTAHLRPRMADHVDETDFEIGMQPDKVAATVEAEPPVIEPQPAAPLTDAEREAARQAEADAALAADKARAEQAAVDAAKAAADKEAADAAASLKPAEPLQGSLDPAPADKQPAGG